MLLIRKLVPIVAAAALFAVVPPWTGHNAAFAHPSIDIAAANWKFTPSKIEAHVGEATTLRIVSSEGVHGIKSDELGIATTTIIPGKVMEVTFTPKKTGTYIIHCAIPCGPGHDDMALTVVVKA